jgi:hypothetical protein
MKELSNGIFFYYSIGIFFLPHYFTKINEKLFNSKLVYVLIILSIISGVVNFAKAFLHKKRTSSAAYMIGFNLRLATIR